ncbi:MAG: TRAP transporter large permease, partial [Candidatus Eremiobacteraeota bacterium]|nr:TRAP transporter large permease [Candidatus Eremiobacteraeota bacterium]
AIPLFILAGNIMNQGGIARRLVQLAKLLMGPFPGALAHCNILANMMFGAISGSAVSSAAAVGKIMLPLQTEEGYDPAFATAVNVASAPTGLIIPPSGALILFSLVSGGTSVAALFVAGYAPGILMGLGLMGLAAWKARRENYPTYPRPKLAELWRATLEALPSLFMVVVVIGGILKGYFTASEASAIAVLYALVLAMAYKEVKLADLPALFLDSTVTTAIVLFLVGASVTMSWVFAVANIPETVVGALAGVSDNPKVMLLLINLLLLVCGTFLDLTPALLIFTPLFLPIVQSFGVHPVHFGIVMTLNLCIGICTPPVGSLLFVGSSVSGVEIPAIVRHLLPIYAVLIVVLGLVTFFPELSLFLPRMWGLL